MNRALVVALLALATSTYGVPFAAASPQVRHVPGTIYGLPGDDTAQCLDAERVCIGTEQTARNEAHLHAIGVTHIVSTVGEPRDGRLADMHYLVLELALPTTTNVDGTASEPVRTERFMDSVKRMHAFIDAALTQQHQQHKVLVYSAESVSRSASLLAYYLARTSRYNMVAAIELLAHVPYVLPPHVWWTWEGAYSAQLHMSDEALALWKDEDDIYLQEHRGVCVLYDDDDDDVYGRKIIRYKDNDLFDEHA